MPQSSSCLRVWLALVATSLAGPGAGQEVSLSPTANEAMSRLVAAMYPDIKAPTLRTEPAPTGSLNPLIWSVWSRHGNSGVEQEVLRLGADFFVRGRPHGLRARGPWVNTATLQALEDRWATQVLQPSASDVDRELRRLGARFGRADRQRLLRSLRPRLRQSFDSARSVRVVGTEFDWLDEHETGDRAHRPHWALLVDVRWPDGDQGCYNLLVEPIAGQLIALQETSGRLLRRSNPAACR